MTKYIVKVLIIVSLFLNAVLLFSNFSKPIQKTASNESKKYPLVSKRIFVEDQNDILVNFVSLRNQLRLYIESIDDPVGMYFEYLPSGVSIGIQEKDDYVLASLLKVPLVMGVYDEINKGTIKRDQILTVTEGDIDKDFGDFWKKGVGTKITVEEAIRLVLIDSDNTSKNLLLHLIGPEKLDQVFDYLDIPKDSEENGPVVTPKNYSSILRSLYLASYLPVEMSNEILTLMTQSHFSDKVVAGVPSGVKVAHKIGVYEMPDNDDREVYTDCGIVYVPKRPYILCLMSKSSEKMANKHFSEISKIIYNNVSTNR